MTGGSSTIKWRDVLKEDSAPSDPPTPSVSADRDSFVTKLNFNNVMASPRSGGISEVADKDKMVKLEVGGLVNLCCKIWNIKWNTTKESSHQTVALLLEHTQNYHKCPCFQRIENSSQYNKMKKAL